MALPPMPAWTTRPGRITGGAARFEAKELRSVADIVEAVLALLEAKTGRKLRTQFQVLREFGVEKRSKASIFDLGRGPGRRGLCINDYRRGSRNNRRSNKQPTQITHTSGPSSLRP